VSTKKEVIQFREKLELKRKELELKRKELEYEQKELIVNIEKLDNIIADMKEDNQLPLGNISDVDTTQLFPKSLREDV
jgi:hypothetical protein